MKRFRKVYLEISNVCNLSCSFCPGTKRKPHIMNEAEFAAIAEKLRPYTDFLYFHLMGEPLCHPELPRFLEIAGGLGFKVILTTNGTLLSKHQNILINAPADAACIFTYATTGRLLCRIAALMLSAASTAPP